MKSEDFKYNWPLVGNAHITEFLGKSIARENVRGTYIFNGPDNLGKTTVANHFAQILLCEKDEKNKMIPCGSCISCRSFLLETGENLELGNAHADFHFIKKEKDKKKISVEQVRDFIQALQMSSFSGVYKVGIIKHADSLSTEAANALLKTLEEPNENVVVILITQNTESLPQTIISRSQVLNYRLVDADTIYEYLVNNHNAGRVEAKEYARMSLGRPALALKFLEDADFRLVYKKKVNLFLNFFDQDINDRILAIEELLGKKAQGQESVRLAKRVLEVWHGVVRDFLLLSFSQLNLIQHPQVEKFNNYKFRAEDLLKFQNLFKEGEKHLNSNVNPKLVLENIAINI